MKKRILLSLAAVLFAFSVKADEGMWITKELDEISVARMQELGFTYPIDSLYSEKTPSLKDAIVIFDGGCTGVVVSDEGLVFTNHHCGYNVIQQLSAIEHDYLKDGFASQSKQEELAAEGLQVSFLKETKDITDFITANITDSDTEEQRDLKIQTRSQEYLKIYDENEFLKASIIPFYSKNKYYLVVYEQFKDIRLVFAPPSSVGKFGGETDNWMWPRHTGDFSVFRVYANKDNQPAHYSEDNIPYAPKYSVPVSIKGYKENDYAMTMGYPGRTQRYMPSWGIEQMVESVHEPRIDVRGEKQAIWRKAMNGDDAIRIKYASKYATSSNYWKNAMGMNEAIDNMAVIQNKEELEKQFTNWLSSSDENKNKYSKMLPLLESAYTKTMDLAAIRTYYYEVFNNGIEIVQFVYSLQGIKARSQEDKEHILRDRMEGVYKDYEISLDKDLMPILLELYAQSVPKEYLPTIYNTIQKKFKGDYVKYANWFYKNSKITSLQGATQLLNMNNKDFMKDPALELTESLNIMANKINVEGKDSAFDISQGNREFMEGLIEMSPQKAFSPDANFTQRLSYGSVQSYSPADAIYYSYFSTPTGIFEKHRENDPEFHIQDYILNALDYADFGQYADEDGLMHVNFLSNNDITGGNSGSPVLNGNAELIGLAFDGNWEALSGDIVFNPAVQRCINVDIRYALYIIDKVMKCPRIIDELKLVK